MVSSKKQVTGIKIKDLSPFVSMKDNPNNKIGLLEISSFNNEGDFCLVTPSKVFGSILIQWFNGQTFESKFVIEVVAHKGAIKAIGISKKGDIIATASENGTLIKLWYSKTGNFIYELRRGTEPAVINYLSFDAAGKYLVVSSDRPTVHIFKIAKDAGGNTTSWMSSLSVVSDYLKSNWAYAKVKFEISQTDT